MQQSALRLQISEREKERERALVHGYNVVQQSSRIVGDILPISLDDTYIFGMLQEPFLGRLSVGDGLLGCEGLLNRKDEYYYR